MSPRPDEPGSDPGTRPADPTDETTTDPVETNAMTTDDRNENPRDVPDPTADPEVTTEIPAASTRALPSAAPFRVEPSAPVPDDVVAPGSELPHLPPPTAATAPASPAPPTAATAPVSPAPQAAPQPAPRPTIVTVNKGPRPATVMLGLLTVLVAAYLLLANLTHADLGFAVSGPSVVGAFGGILLLVGLAGVVAGRLRRR